MTLKWLIILRLQVKNLKNKIIYLFMISFSEEVVKRLIIYFYLNINSKFAPLVKLKYFLLVLLHIYYPLLFIFLKHFVKPKLFNEINKKL